MMAVRIKGAIGCGVLAWAMFGSLAYVAGDAPPEWQMWCAFGVGALLSQLLSA
jgi:hypothetical protein